MFKFDDSSDSTSGRKWLEPGEGGRQDKRFRWVYRTEKVGSQLTAAEIAENYELVVRAKKSELNGIMKHDAMKAVRKADRDATDA